ncbi:MAG: hypothetical protein OJF50_006572 [Nitrospira sp.]|jgi:hypothetical protein|nr:hypothetical protein [Nitrospira sp.]
MKTLKAATGGPIPRKNQGTTGLKTCWRLLRSNFVFQIQLVMFVFASFLLKLYLHE